MREECQAQVLSAAQEKIEKNDEENERKLKKEKHRRLRRK